MTNTKTYATYHIFFENHPDKIKKIEFKDSISLDFRKDPSFLHWKKKKNDSRLEFTKKPSREEIVELEKDYEQAYQLLINAKDEKIAQNISNLIHGGRLLNYPNIFEHPEITEIYEIKYDGYALFFEKTKHTDNIFIPCLIASKSWGNNSLVYSIEKYRFSLRQDCITPHSAAPYHGQIFSINEKEYEYHVQAAYSMFSACSIIEELKVNINANSENPRFNKEKTDWNPAVKKDILNKLEKIGINEDETIDWVIRGKETKLFKNSAPVLGEKSPYFDGKTIFDIRFKVYEAINVASYIRNKIIGHKFDGVVSNLNPYDVYNLQMLERRLILSKLGFWKNKILTE